LTEADRAFDRRAYDEALSALRTALGLATREDNQVYVRFRIALALRRLGRPLEARSALRALVDAHNRHPRAARALYVAARIREADLGDAPGAEAELAALLDLYPASDSAGQALDRLVRRKAGRDPEATLDFLRKVARRHRRGPLGPRALYRAARLYEERLKSPERALRLYEILARGHPKSGFFDDALWRAARLHRAAKRPGPALKLCRRLTSTRRESWLLGSYNSVHLDKAALEIAHILLEDLRDPPAAARALREFVADYPHSFLRSRARRLLVETHLRMGEVAEARRELAELERLHPRSREARQARKALEASAGRAPVRTP
jgi:hypothetical protein